MKLWRKEAMKAGKKNGTRPGRQIKAGAQMQSYIFKNLPKTYPLLNTLFARAGVMPTTAPQVTEEDKNETV